MQHDLPKTRPPIVSPQEWETARGQLLVEEKALTRARDALAAKRRRMPWMEMEKAYEFEGPQGKAGLIHGGRPSRPCGPSKRPRHYPRVRLACAAGGYRPPQGANGLDYAVVQPHGQLRRRCRCGRVARHKRLHPRRRPRVPHLLRQQPRRRGDGQHLELSRHHSARAPGGLGGLAGRLPADADLQMVELARQLRGRGVTEPEMGRGLRRRRGRLPEPRYIRHDMSETAIAECARSPSWWAGLNSSRGSLVLGTQPVLLRRLDPESLARELHMMAAQEKARIAPGSSS